MPSGSKTPKGFKHKALTKTGSSNGVLPPRQVLFVKSYLSNGFNGAAAAVKAGYSAKTAAQIAGRLLATPTVMEAVAEGKKKLFSQYDVTAERVIGELARLGFSNMDDYMTVQPDGSATLDLTNLTRDQAAAIQQLDSEVYMERVADEDGEYTTTPVKKCRIRLHDKRAPLQLLGQHLGIFEEDNKGRQVQVRILFDANERKVAAELKA